MTMPNTAIEIMIIAVIARSSDRSAPSASNSRQASSPITTAPAMNGQASRPS